MALGQEGRLVVRLGPEASDEDESAVLDELLESDDLDRSADRLRELSGGRGVDAERQA